MTKTVHGIFSPHAARVAMVRSHRALAQAGAPVAVPFYALAALAALVAFLIGLSVF